MKRFFAPPASWDPSRVRLSEAESEHALRIVRLKRGDEVEVFDGAGRWARSKIAVAKASGVELELMEPPRLDPRPEVPVILAQALIRREKMKLVLQKAVELGAAEIRLFQSERSVVKISEDRDLGKHERVVIEAMKQCGLNHAPRLALFPSLDETLRNIDASHKRIFFWEGAKAKPLKTAIDDPRPAGVVVIVGPEGGFSSREADLARENNCEIKGLGRIILRAETAALVALTIAQFVWGDLSG